jgi:carboxyl-terminal processing protease
MANKIFEHMKRPLILVMLLAGVFLAFRTMGTTSKPNPPTKYEKILAIVGAILTQGTF